MKYDFPFNPSYVLGNLIPWLLLFASEGKRVHVQNLSWSLQWIELPTKIWKDLDEVYACTYSVSSYKYINRSTLEEWQAVGKQRNIKGSREENI